MKEKSCQGCPDRCADPNCHTTCEAYKRRVQARREAAAKRASLSEVYDMCAKRSIRLAKRGGRRR